MLQFKSAALGLVIMAAGCGQAFAQSSDAMAKAPLASDHMSKGSMTSNGMASDAKKMAKADAKTTAACRKMSHKAMMKDPRCQAGAEASAMSDGAMGKDAPMKNNGSEANFRYWREVDLNQATAF